MYIRATKLEAEEALAILSDFLFEKVLINIQEETERNTITVYVIIENVNFCSGMLKIQ
jgi:hypothetical protein